MHFSPFPNETVRGPKFGAISRCIRIAICPIAPNSRRLGMQLPESLGKRVVGENRFQNALKDHIGKSSIESRILEHVENEHHSLASCLASNQMLQLFCTIQCNRHLKYNSHPRRLISELGRLHHARQKTVQQLHEAFRKRLMINSSKAMTFRGLDDGKTKFS